MPNICVEGMKETTALSSHHSPFMVMELTITLNDTVVVHHWFNFSHPVAYASFSWVWTLI